MIKCGTRTLLARTCKACKELQPGKQFARVKGGWRFMCNRCLNERYRPDTLKKQDVTTRTAHQHRARWTDIEIEILKEHIRDKTPAATIALDMGRSLFSIYDKQQKLKKKGDL